MGAHGTIIQHAWDTGAHACVHVLGMLLTPHLERRIRMGLEFRERMLEKCARSEQGLGDAGARPKPILIEEAPPGQRDAPRFHAFGCLHGLAPFRYP